MAAFLPLLRNRELFEIFDTTSKLLNELPTLEKDLIKKFSDRYVFRKTSHTEDGYEIVVHLPGVGKDNIVLEVLEEDRSLSVTYHDEVVCFALPDYVNTSDEGYTASYVDGVLRVVFTKKAERSGRRSLNIN